MADSYAEWKKKRYPALLAQGVSTPTSGGSEYDRWKMKHFPQNRDAGSPFKDREYGQLEFLYKTLTRDIGKLKREREATTDEAERDKRLRVIDATSEYRSSVKQLRDAKKQILQLDYTVNQGLAAGQEDQAAKLRRKLQDVEATSREYMEDFKLLPELLAKVPAPGSGKKGSPELLTELSGVLQRTEKRGLTMEALNDITRKGELLTRSDIPESQKHEIERNLGERSDILKGIGQLTGVGDPHQVFDYKDPEGFWQSDWNPWHHTFELGRNTLKLVNAVPQGFAGGLKGLAGSIMPQEKMTPAMQEETGHYADKYRGKPVVGQVGGFLEGFVRGLDDPWEKGLSYSGFDPWLEQMSKTPVTGFLDNPWVKTPLSFGLEVASDPLSFMGGGASKAGKAIFGADDLIKQVDILAKWGTPKYLKKATKLTGAAWDQLDEAGLIPKTLKGTNVASDRMTIMKHLTSGASDPYYKQILAGRKQIGFRSLTQPHQMANVPDSLRQVEAAIAKPFSTGMDVMRKTGFGEFMANKFNAKPFMQAPMRETAEHKLLQNRMVAGEAARMSRTGKNIFKGMPEPVRAQVFEAAENPELAAKLSKQQAVGLTWYQDLMKQAEELEAASGLKVAHKHGYAPHMFTLENSKRGVWEKTLEVRHGVGDIEKTVDDPAQATSKIYTTKIDHGNLDWLKDMVEEHTGVAPRAGSVDELVDEVADIQKQTGLPFYMKRGHKLEDKLAAGTGADRVYVTMPVSLPHGKETRLLSKGVSGRPALWMADEQTTSGAREAAARFPTMITDPYQAALARTTTGLSNVASNELRRFVGDKFGIDPSMFREMGDIGPQAFKPLDFKAGRLLPEALQEPYYKTKDIKSMLKGISDEQGLSGMKEAAAGVLPDLDVADIGKALDEGEVTSDVLRQLGKHLDIKPRGKIIGEATDVQKFIPNRIGTYLDTQFKSMSSNATLKTLDKIENVWKGYATALRPGFHARNAISNMWLLYLGGMNPLDIDAHIKAVKLMRAKNMDEPMKIRGITHTVGEWRGMAEDYAALGHSLHGADLGEIAKQQQFATGAEKWAHRGGKLFHPLNEDFMLTDLGRALGTGIEDEARMVGWVSAMKQGDNPITAAKRVNKFLFDYSDITNFEKGVMRRVMPFYCLTADARAVTRDGLKTYKELTVGEEILTLNHKTETLEWKPVNGIFHAPYNGQMIHLKGQSLDVTCTPDHRWVSANYKGDVGICETWKLTTGHKLILSGEYDQGEYDIADDILWFIAWIAGDGYSRQRSKNYTEHVIYQSPKKYADEIRDRLQGYDYGESKPHPDTGTICFHLNGRLNKDICKHYREKGDFLLLIPKLSKRQLDIAYDAFFKAEGCVSREGTPREHREISQIKDESLREALQLMCYLRGNRSKLGGHGLYERKKRKGSKTKVSYLNPSIVNYEGVVWCPNTENSTWVAQVNGHIFATGNTWARKNIPLEVEQMFKQPQKFTHTMGALEALERSGMEAHGADEMKKQEQFRPDYFKDLFATLTPWSWKEKPMFLNPNLPFQDLTNLTDIPKLLGGKPGEAENVLFMLNPLLKAIPAIFGGSLGRDVIPEMPQGTAPWFAKMLNAVLPGEDLATEGISEYSGMPEPKVPGWVDYAASQLPLLQDLIEGFRGRSDQPLQQLSRFGGVKTIPFDWERQSNQMLEESKWEMSDLVRRLEKAQGREFDYDPDYKMPKLKVPPASVTLYDFMYKQGIPNRPVTAANYRKAKRLYEQMKGPFAPMNWPTLSDMQQVTRSKAYRTFQGSYDQYKEGWQPEYKTMPTELYEPGTVTADGETYEEWRRRIGLD